MDEFSLVQKVIIWAIPVLFAVTLHEVAHGWAALQFGDRTAQMLGRLTLNPLKHIDLLGTILIPILLMVTISFPFGWAKSLPITYENLRNPKAAMSMVAVAGPFSNLVMAVLWAVLAKVVVLYSDGRPWIEPLLYMAMAGIFFNTILMVLNLLPIPPLDGGYLWESILPEQLSSRLVKLEPYGLFILVGLSLVGVLGAILWPLVMGFTNFLVLLFELPLQIFSIF